MLTRPKTLDQRINRIKNSIRSLFANCGLELARGRRAWSAAGRERIDSYRKPLADCSMDELWQGQLDFELTQLDSLSELSGHAQTTSSVARWGRQAARARPSDSPRPGENRFDDYGHYEGAERTRARQYS